MQFRFALKAGGLKVRGSGFNVHAGIKLRV